MEAPGIHKEQIILFGETNFRDKKVRFGIKPDDRRRHMYMIGKTGVGKTTLIENMVVQDIQCGHGVAVIDPHGEFADRMLDFIPSERVQDVVYFNPSDLNYPIAFNAIEQVPVEYRHLVASGLMAVFKKIWVDLWSARMEYILNNTLLSLLEVPGSTLLGVNRMLADKTYRHGIVERLTDPVVKAFWLNEFERYDAKFRAEAVAPIQNKVGQFASNPLIRNIIGQVKSKLNLREIIDTKKILIVNLSKGLIGEENSALLGAMLVTKLQLAAMSRVDIPEPERSDFYLYVDEFQNYSTDSFANILSEARKYRLNLILAHQYLEQLPETVRSSIVGNVGTIVSFRIGAEDAEFMEQEFAPEFLANDLLNLAKFNFYIKLMIDGTASRAFSATNLPPPNMPTISHREDIIRISRERYSTPRQEVEDSIRSWSGEYINMSGGERTEPGSTNQHVTASTRPMWNAVCANCQKPTRIPFEPDIKRPVYCEICWKHLRETKKLPLLAQEKPARVGERQSAKITMQPIPKPISLSATLAPKLPQLPPNVFPQRKKQSVDLEGLRSVLKEALKEK
jgi:CxxC-x17-CxxC domain-containing protein